MRNRQWQRWLAPALVLLAVTISSGCGGGNESEPVSRTFVGDVAGSDAFVGLVSEGENIRAYVCDNKSISAWFEGAATDGRLTTTAKRGEKLVLELSEDAATGTITLGNGRTLDFWAGAATGGDAGVYRAEAAGVVAGWVVLEDGRQRGGVGGFGKGILPAPPLDTRALATDKVSFTPVTIPRLGPGDPPALPIPPSEGGRDCPPVCELRFQRLG